MISRGVRWQLMKGKQCWWINQWFNWSMHKGPHLRTSRVQKLFWWFSPVLKIYVLHLERQLSLPASCALELVVGLRDLLYSSVSPVTPIFTDTPPGMHVGLRLSITMADCVAQNAQKTTVLSHHCCQHTYFLLSAEREKVRYTCGRVLFHFQWWMK